MGGGVKLKSQQFPLNEEIQDAISRDDLIERAIAPMGRVLEQILQSDTEKQLNWLNDARTYVEELAKNAPNAFNEAFDRWRELYSFAYRQLREANKGLETHGISGKDRQKYRILSTQANAQIQLLTDGKSKYSSDFFTYRYLATEGFLPGYNFPRLPLYAYVPGQGQKGTFLSRARFFGISEFGPGNLIYHEGRAYRVVKAKLPVGEIGTEGPNLNVSDIYLCSNCGACHEQEVELCHVCKRNLADKDLVKRTLRIDNVEAISAERITANDEERVRRGYEIQTVFSWPKQSNNQYRVQEAVCKYIGKTLFSLQYANSAEISRINKGLKRRKDKAVYGFNINPKTGWWESAEEEKQKGILDPEKAPPVRIVPIVRDRKNALLLSFNDPSSLEIEAKATIQHALIRGIEVAYQLEQGEILGEPLPNRDNRRTILIYEATEGGAGILKCLIEDERAIRNVARVALNLMHYEDVDTLVKLGDAELRQSNIHADSKLQSCNHGCYRCLLSYYNQLDHEIIERDRSDVVQFLIDIANGKLETKSTENLPVDQNDIHSDWLQKFLDEDLPVPELAPVTLSGHAFEIVWNDYFVVATTNILNGEAEKEIENHGWVVVQLPETPEDGVPFKLIKALKGV